MFIRVLIIFCLSPCFFSREVAPPAITLDGVSTYGYRRWQKPPPTPDPINCDLTAAGVQRQPDSTYTIADTCRKEAATCHLPNFLADHQQERGAIADYLAAHPNVIKDQVRVERLLAAVIADPEAALGQAACWPLGDVIIALQVPPDAALWTLDPDPSAALRAGLKSLAEMPGLRLYQSTAAQ